jgi:hypothetical protein
LNRLTKLHPYFFFSFIYEFKTDIKSLSNSKKAIKIIFMDVYSEPAKIRASVRGKVSGLAISGLISFCVWKLGVVCEGVYVCGDISASRRDVDVVLNDSSGHILFL